MSKRKTGEVKDNNISSKLLGANLSDINIEKFRDVSQLKKEKYQISGKCTIPILKIIFTITLPNQAISNIDALEECQNLMVLNLSKNTIENINALRKLTKLRIADLSQNAITSIEVLRNCKELVNLHLEGNMIKGIDQLKGLKQCPQFRNLHLQTLKGDSQNPICSLSSYRNNINQQLPQIKRLDSIPITMEFNNGSEIKETKKKQLKIDMKTIGPFYTNKFPTIAQYTPPTFSEEQSLKKSLATCKSSIQELEIKMRMLLTT